MHQKNISAKLQLIFINVLQGAAGSRAPRPEIGMPHLPSPLCTQINMKTDQEGLDVVVASSIGSLGTNMADKSELKRKLYASILLTGGAARLPGLDSILEDRLPPSLSLVPLPCLPPSLVPPLSLPCPSLIPLSRLLPCSSAAYHSHQYQAVRTTAASPRGGEGGSGAIRGSRVQGPPGRGSRGRGRRSRRSRRRRGRRRGRECGLQGPRAAWGPAGVAWGCYHRQRGECEGHVGQARRVGKRGRRTAP